MFLTAVHLLMHDILLLAITAIRSDVHFCQLLNGRMPNLNQMRGEGPSGFVEGQAFPNALYLYGF